MNNSFLSKLLLAALIILPLLTGCQKDSTPLPDPVPNTDHILQTTSADDRATYIYGVTVWTSGSASKVVKIDFASGTVVGAVNVTASGVLVKDLKGICTVSGVYYVTTGTNNAAGLQYRLMKIDPNTGVVSAIFNPNFPAPISDICFRDVTPLGIYGLKDNSNSPVRIDYNGGAWSSTTTFMSLPISPLTASGLCWGKATPNYKIFIAAGDAGGNVKLFNWDPATQVTTGVTNLTPAADFPSANLGLGYFSIGGIGLINRRTTSPGLNKISWGPLPPTGLWGGVGGYVYEDMCSVL